MSKVINEDLRQPLLEVSEEIRAELTAKLAAAEAEVERLKMYEDWDMNWAKCEACQRWTQLQDMRHTDEGDEYASCCLWCLKLDRLHAIEKAARAFIEADGTLKGPAAWKVLLATLSPGKKGG